MQKSMLLPQSNIKNSVRNKGKVDFVQATIVSATDIHILIAFNSIVITFGIIFQVLMQKGIFQKAFDLHGLNLKTFYL